MQEAFQKLLRTSQQSKVTNVLGACAQNLPALIQATSPAKGLPHTCPRAQGDTKPLPQDSHLTRHTPARALVLSSPIPSTALVWIEGRCPGQTMPLTARPSSGTTKQQSSSHLHCWHSSHRKDTQCYSIFSLSLLNQGFFGSCIFRHKPGNKMATLVSVKSNTASCSLH